MTTSGHVVCPQCKGKRFRVVYACPGFRRMEVSCEPCNGSGEVLASRGEQMIAWHEQGEALRKVRIERRETQREAAERLGIGVVQYSRIEHGLEALP